VPEDGEVSMVTTRGHKGTNTSDIVSLALQTDQMTCFSKDKPYFRVRVYSKEANYLRVSRCKQESEIVQLILEVLQTGVDNIDVTICREVFELEFDKVQIVEEYDSAHPGKKAEHLPKQWLITHFLWATVHEYRLEGEEHLQVYFNKLTQMLATGKQNTAKADMMKEMSERHHFDKLEIERFSEAFAEGTSTNYKTSRYLHLNAAKAPTRKFELIRRYDLIPKGECLDDGGGQKSLTSEREWHTLEDCVKRMMREVESARKRMENWRLTLAWEPGKYITVEEHMHKAKRCQMRNNESGLSGTIQHIVEFLNKHGDNARLRSMHAGESVSKGGADKDPMFCGFNIDVERLPQVKPDHMDLIYSVNKKAVDKLVSNYEEGLATQEQFEEKLIATCERMMRLIDNVVLPVARHKRSYQSYANGLRVKADYMRYLNIYVPSYPNTTALENQNVYEDALKIAFSEELKPRDLAAISSCVNYSLFLAEVKRDVAAAAALCEEAVRNVQARELTNQPTPSEIFNWQLLKRNMEAFQCWLVFLAVRFNADSVAQQMELSHIRIGAQAKEQEHRKLQQAAEAAGKDRHCLDRCASKRAMEKKAAQQAKAMALPHVRSNWCRSETPEMRAVHHWIRGRPLYQQQSTDVKASRGHDKPTSAFKIAKWIEAVEELDTTALPEDLQEKLRKAEEQAAETEEAQGKQGQDDKSSKLYLLACVVQPRPEQEQTPRGMPRSNLTTGLRPPKPVSREVWSLNLQEEIRDWPVRGNTHHIKELKLGKPEESKRFSGLVLAHMDDDGILEHEARVGDNPNVYPGDTMIVPEDMSIQEFKAAESKKAAGLGTTLMYRFVPCLKTSSCCILDIVEYVDVHQKFHGFPRGKTLQPANTDFSLEALRAQIAMEKKEEKVNAGQDGAVTRRRIPGLSARRDPKQASARGCK